MRLSKKLFIIGALVFIQNLNAQTNWSLQDLQVITFRNGDPLMEANSESNWKYCNANQEPAYYKLGKSLEDGVLYNYYAIIDERQLAPVGYSIPELEDIKVLPNNKYYQSSLGGWKTNIGTGYFNADANGYLPFEGETLELLSQGDAAYYWTKTNGKALHSMGFVIMNGDKGYSLQEMRRENFCAVRCIKNEAEAVAFEKSESEILVSRQKKEKLLAEEKALEVAEEKRLAEERVQKEADEKKKRDELAKRDAEAKKEAEDKLQKEQSKNKYILGGDSNNNTVNQNGQILVYISSDIGCGNIDVTVNGVTKKITNFHDTEPNCSSKGCAVFSLPPGEYNVKASCSSLSWSFVKTVVSQQCTKTRLQGNGELMVWISSDFGCGNVDVTVNGVTKNITNFYSTEPSCSSEGCAVFSLPPGEYNVKATCGKLSWDFSKTVKSEECIKTKLINNPK